MVFEKSKGLGGRVTTRRFENSIIDHGLNFISLDNCPNEHKD